MMAAMILLSIILAYPVFMLFMYFLAKVIFTPLDKAAAEHEKERFLLLMKARRTRKKERVFVHA
jgi:H+/gluconate symporter-like permease